MKLDKSKQESSDLKVFGVGPKDSEIKSEKANRLQNSKQRTTPPGSTFFRTRFVLHI